MVTSAPKTDSALRASAFLPVATTFRCAHIFGDLNGQTARRACCSIYKDGFPCRELGAFFERSPCRQAWICDGRGGHVIQIVRQRNTLRRPNDRLLRHAPERRFRKRKYTRRPS